MKEAPIQKSILEYLAVKNIFAIRVNSGMQFGNHNGKKWAIHMAAPGTADILAILDVDDCDCSWSHKRILWIEVKSPTGKQSELQESFQKQVEEEGHSYIVARSIDDVEKALSS